MWKLPDSARPFAYLTKEGKLVYEEGHDTIPIYTKEWVEAQVRMALSEYLTRAWTGVEKLAEYRCHNTVLEAMLIIGDLRVEVWEDEGKY